VEAAKRRAGGIIQLQTSSTCAEREGSTKLYDNHDNHDYHHHHDLLLPLKRTADTRRGGLVVVGRQTLSFFFVFMLLYSPVIVEAFSFLPRQQAVSRQQVCFLCLVLLQEYIDKPVDCSIVDVAIKTLCS